MLINNLWERKEVFMKASDYNEFIEYDGNIIAYNGRTNTLAEISNEEYCIFNSYLVDENTEIKGDYLQQLLYGGFLINDNVNELDILKYNMFSSRFDNSQLSLVIAPTSDCNFRCPYCFESKVLRPNRMDTTIVNAIIKFVKSRTESIQNLHITWYGG